VRNGFMTYSSVDFPLLHNFTRRGHGKNYPVLLISLKRIKIHFYYMVLKHVASKKLILDHSTLSSISFMKLFRTTLCLKKVPPLTCYNLDIHDPITIIFGRSVSKKKEIRRCFVFPRQLSSASPLPCKIGNPEVHWCMQHSPTFAALST